MSQFDDIVGEYEDSLKDLLGGGDIEKYAEYKIQLVRLITKKQKGKFLDFGCGTGRSFTYINHYFPQFDIYGCDVSEESLKCAERYLPANKLFVNTDTKALGCKGSMDVVMAACVFHHIPPQERKSWIASVVENLTDDGLFFIFEHNTKNPMTKKIILDPNNPVDDIKWMLSHRDLLGIVKEIPKAEIIWDGYTLFSPWRPNFMTSLERGLKWLPIGAQHCVVVGRK